MEFPCPREMNHVFVFGSTKRVEGVICRLFLDRLWTLPGWRHLKQLHLIWSVFGIEEASTGTRPANWIETGDTTVLLTELSTKALY